MPITVTLGNASRTTKRSPSENGLVSDIKMSRMFYQFLGSLVKNKTIIEDYDSDKLSLEYKRFLDEMNDLFIVKNYPELSSGIILSENIVEIDQYLGELGVLSEYEYSKDIVNIPSWIDIIKQAEMRILFDESDNTYLTTSNNQEVLVQYTGI